MLERRLGQPEHGVEIGLDRLVELLRGDVVDRLLRGLTGSVDHQHVKTAELACGILHELVAEALVLQVARHRQAFAFLLPGDVQHLARVGLLLRQVVDYHVGALAQESDDRGPADAGIAARHEDAAALKAAGAAVAVLAMIGFRPHVPRQAGPGLPLLRKRRLGSVGVGALRSSRRRGGGRLG